MIGDDGADSGDDDREYTEGTIDMGERGGDDSDNDGSRGDEATSSSTSFPSLGAMFPLVEGSASTADSTGSLGTTGHSATIFSVFRNESNKDFFDVLANVFFGTKGIVGVETPDELRPDRLLDCNIVESLSAIGSVFHCPLSADVRKNVER